MSAYARNFLRLRYWLEGLDGGAQRSLSQYERVLASNLRAQASHLIEVML
ncbi:hypothetical protein [Variovorax sp. PAMC26660]|nr:hypothetical protein [Variovorax sp. PAMC26660]QNK68315.1 hypothetical protein H7F35_00765 [Variovorax sp. PAMC26660]